ncbi:thioredoxin-like domain-containing protein [Flavivirga aquimarina]|uniref:Thioredoxin-like domain-containing protein n=1 Tax=Flavivirga aquimarina TaxID=2027862 RepID=A0ABT8WDZ9_9FLAO|nr:thioredoxin-like domain-containing protein [Flavivirga aquimarina]MDO5971389.1 thioredoxin-like domain-containing protein [Flavivirga aquimarina]
MKIQTKIIILFALIGNITSCSKKHNIKANISGLGNDTIYIENYKISNIEDDPILDTIYSKNGEFSYNLPINEPLISIISPKKSEFIRLNKTPYRPTQKSIILILKPEDNININGKLEKFNLQYKVTGSSINMSYAILREKYAQSNKAYIETELRIDTLMFNKGDREEINVLFKKRNEYSNIARNIQLNYIKSNWDKNLSAFYLTRQPLDTLGKYFERLDKSVKNGMFQNLLNYQCNRFKKYIKVREAELNIKVGEKSPKFSLQNINGEKITIDYSGNKFIILDFWGSWCAPCISGFPKMKEYFNKYNNQISFIGIACNDKEDKWKNAVEKYDLKWENLINNNDINKDVSVMYGIKGYPTKIIINSNGIIEGIFNGEGDDFYKKLDNLMGN